MNKLFRKLLERNKINLIILAALTLIFIFFLSGQALATIVNIQHFPIEGPYWYGNDWLAPRPGHQHHGNDIFPLTSTGRAMYDYNYRLHKVYAVESGVIARIGTISGGGNRIWLKGDSGTGYYYAHLYGSPNRFAFVKEGQRVETGQTLGYVGDTGAAQGGAWHLHFGVNAKGRVTYSESTAISDGMVNPYYYLVRAGAIRIKGIDRYSNAISISNFGWPDGSDKVVITRGSSYVDALSGAPLAAKLKAPMLYTYQNSLLSSVKNEITRLKANEVIILGGTSSISAEVENELVDMGLTVNRVNGATNRYQTSAEIGRLFGSPKYRTAFLINGEEFQSSLTIIASASLLKIPVFITQNNSLASEIKEAIRELGIKKIIIVGNYTKVGSGVESWLQRKGYQTRRIGSSSTNIYYLHNLILNDKVLNTGAKSIFLAQSNNFPNGLATGPLISKVGNGSLILTDSDRLVSTASSYIKKNEKYLKNIYLIGDEKALSEKVRQDLINLR